MNHGRCKSMRLTTTSLPPSRCNPQQHGMTRPDQTLSGLALGVRRDLNRGCERRETRAQWGTRLHGKVVHTSQEKEPQHKPNGRSPRLCNMRHVYEELGRRREREKRARCFDSLHLLHSVSHRRLFIRCNYSHRQRCFSWLFCPSRKSAAATSVLCRG